MIVNAIAMVLFLALLGYIIVDAIKQIKGR